jgi:hypothetical protein
MVAVAKQGCGRPVAPPLLRGGLEVVHLHLRPGAPPPHLRLGVPPLLLPRWLHPLSRARNPEQRRPPSSARRRQRRLPCAPPSPRRSGGARSSTTTTGEHRDTGERCTRSFSGAEDELPPPCSSLSMGRGWRQPPRRICESFGAKTAGERRLPLSLYADGAPRGAHRWRALRRAPYLSVSGRPTRRPRALPLPPGSVAPRLIPLLARAGCVETDDDGCRCGM